MLKCLTSRVYTTEWNVFGGRREASVMPFTVKTRWVFIDLSWASYGRFPTRVKVRRRRRPVAGGPPSACAPTRTPSDRNVAVKRSRRAFGVFLFHFFDSYDITRRYDKNYICIGFAFTHFGGHFRFCASVCLYGTVYVCRSGELLRDDCDRCVGSGRYIYRGGAVQRLRDRPGTSRGIRTRARRRQIEGVHAQGGHRVTPSGRHRLLYVRNVIGAVSVRRDAMPRRCW